MERRIRGRKRNWNLYYNNNVTLVYAVFFISGFSCSSSHQLSSKYSCSKNQETVSAMKMETEITVLTLNCWGIKGISLDRSERMTAIAEAISTGQYDFVFLQEVWAMDDYEKIKRKTENVLPYSHYFHSGVIGAGICIFSKAPIKSAFFHQWAVNGYVHKIYHGDWFGGKGIGLVQVVHHGLLLNLYTTHLHAEYDRVNDEYAAHRVTQAFDTAQFISLTSQNADLVIVGGDLNTEPGDLAYRVIVHVAQLRDAYFEIEKPTGSEHIGYTNEIPGNSYTSPRSLVSCPLGKRIDYIVYKPGKFVKAETLSCETPWPRRVPGKSFSYSDHEAVVARIRLSKSQVEEPVSVNKTSKVKEALEESIEVCSQALKNLQTSKNMYYCIGMICMIVLLALSSLETSGLVSYVKTGTQLIFITFLAFSAFQGVIWNRMEVHGILAGKLSMELQLYNDVKYELVEEYQGDHCWTEVNPADCNKL